MGLKQNCLAFLLLVMATVHARNVPQNETASVVTTYAKVASFGNKTPTVNEGRSSGMSLYTQSSHAKVISGQNLRSRFSPYFTSKPSRLSHGVTEIYPAKGEVQERFNPRPYLEYLHVPPKKHQTSSGSSQPAPSYGMPFDSFPVFNGGQSENGNGGNPSVFSSETNSKPSDGGMESGGDSFNLNPSMTGEKNSNGPSEDSMFPMDSYQPTNEDNSKPMSGDSEYPGFPYAPSPDGMPSKEPSKESESEDASETGPEIVPTLKSPHDNDFHDFPHHQYQGVGPKIINTVRPPGSVEMPYQDHPPSYYYPHHEGGPMEDDKQMDNTPMGGSPQEMDTPKQMPNGYPKLPDYLDHDPKEHGYNYPDIYHYDHHVYHPITTTTTTTTAAPEERVNNNYSYYYLGRKLWYIPLYFSAYFIIYITVLILKSIARHKVSFWHDLHNLGGNRRQGRNLELDEITRNVTGSIENARNKYMK